MAGSDHIMQYIRELCHVYCLGLLMSFLGFLPLKDSATWIHHKWPKLQDCSVEKRWANPKRICSGEEFPWTRISTRPSGNRSKGGHRARKKFGLLNPCPKECRRKEIRNWKESRLTPGDFDARYFPDFAPAQHDESP